MCKRNSSASPNHCQASFLALNVKYTMSRSNAMPSIKPPSFKFFLLCPLQTEVAIIMASLLYKVRTSPTRKNLSSYNAINSIYFQLLPHSQHAHLHDPYPFPREHSRFCPWLHKQL